MGTHSVHAYISVPVRVTLIYHANYPNYSKKIPHFTLFNTKNWLRNNVIVNFILVGYQGEILGNYSLCPCVYTLPVRVTLIYHANYPIIAKISTLNPI